MKYYQHFKQVMENTGIYLDQYPLKTRNDVNEAIRRYETILGSMLPKSQVNVLESEILAVHKVDESNGQKFLTEEQIEQREMAGFDVSEYTVSSKKKKAIVEASYALLEADDEKKEDDKEEPEVKASIGDKVSYKGQSCIVTDVLDDEGEKLTVTDEAGKDYDVEKSDLQPPKMAKEVVKEEYSLYEDEECDDDKDEECDDDKEEDEDEEDKDSKYKSANESIYSLFEDEEDEEDKKDDGGKDNYDLDDEMSEADEGKDIDTNKDIPKNANKRPSEKESKEKEEELTDTESKKNAKEGDIAESVRSLFNKVLVEALDNSSITVRQRVEIIKNISEELYGITEEDDVEDLDIETVEKKKANKQPVDGNKETEVEELIDKETSPDIKGDKPKVTEAMKNTFNTMFSIYSLIPEEDMIDFVGRTLQESSTSKIRAYIGSAEKSKLIENSNGIYIKGQAL